MIDQDVDLITIPAIGTEGGERGQGHIILAHMELTIEGMGSFSIRRQTGGPKLYNTLNGDLIARLEVGSGYVLNPEAFAGWKFSHWFFNGQPAGVEAERHLIVEHGLVILAVFVPAD